MKRKTTIVMATALASIVLLNTSIWVIPSKAVEAVKTNFYFASQKTKISEITKQNELANLSESVKLAQTAAKIAKQEEIDRVAIERPTAPKQAKLAQVKLSELNLGIVTKEESDILAKIEVNRVAKIESDRLAELNPTILTEEEAEAERLAKIEADRLTKIEADRLAKLEEERLAKVEADRLAKIEVDRLAKIEKDRLAKIEADKNMQVILNNQTVTGTKLSTYLNSTAHVSSVLNAAVVLHGGNPTNTCVYFSSEAMRRIGVSVPYSTANTKQYLAYLRAHAYIASYDIKNLTPGTICFTTNNWQGQPTHTFAFMGWVTGGNYTLAYVADNQGSSVHIRNMGATSETDAFAFYMHTPTQPTQISAASSGYNSINISWSPSTGASLYGIYRATSSTGTYSLISSTTATRYKNTGLTTNNTYYYKIRSYRSVGTFKQFSGLSEATSSKPILATPISVKAVSSSNSSINISWGTVMGASLYGIYRASSNEGPYTLISSTTKTGYNNTGLTTNNTYYYKVRSYKTIGTVKVFSDLSTSISSTPIPPAPTNLKATRITPNNIKLTWNTVTGANGYEIYTTALSTVPYTLLSDTVYLFYNNSDLITETTYYYKIRSYQIIGTTKIYGNFAPAIYSRP